MKLRRLREGSGARHSSGESHVMSRYLTLAVALALCLVSFLAGAYVASNNIRFRNCFVSGGAAGDSGGTPCMDLGGEQRDPSAR